MGMSSYCFVVVDVVYRWNDSPFSQTGETNMKSLLATSELQGM